MDDDVKLQYYFHHCAYSVRVCLFLNFGTCINKDLWETVYTMSIYMPSPSLYSWSVLTSVLQDDISVYFHLSSVVAFEILQCSL